MPAIVFLFFIEYYSSIGAKPDMTKVEVYGHKRMLVLGKNLEPELGNWTAQRLGQPFGGHCAVTPGTTVSPLEAE